MSSHYLFYSLGNCLWRMATKTSGIRYISKKNTGQYSANSGAKTCTTHNAFMPYHLRWISADFTLILNHVNHAHSLCPWFKDFTNYHFLISFCKLTSPLIRLYNSFRCSSGLSEAQRPLDGPVVNWYVLTSL